MHKVNYLVSIAELNRSIFKVIIEDSENIVIDCCVPNFRTNHFHIRQLELQIIKDSHFLFFLLILKYIFFIDLYINQLVFIIDISQHYFLLIYQLTLLNELFQFHLFNLFQQLQIIHQHQLVTNQYHVNLADHINIDHILFHFQINAILFLQLDPRSIVIRVYAAVDIDRKNIHHQFLLLFTQNY